MNIDYTPSVWFLVGGLPLAAYLLWSGWRHRGKPGAVPFLVLISLSTAWVVGSILELLSASLPVKVLWADFQYLPICFVPVTWVALALDYTGHRALLTRRNAVLMCLLPLIMLGLQWTNVHHHLMRASVWLDTSSSHPVIGRTFGPMFWIHVAYSYVLIVVAMALLLHFVLSRPPMFRKQPALLFVGFAVPYIWNVMFVLIRPSWMPAFDYTPALFAVGEMFVAYSLFRLHMFDLVNVARDSIMENMTDGFLVLDHQGVVLDINEAARSIIARPVHDILGEPIADSWLAWDEVARSFDTEDGTAMISLTLDGRRRDFEIGCSHLAGSPDVSGRVLVMHDVTERSALEDSLRLQALTDGLTGLPNRTLFMAKLGDAVHVSRRYANKLFAVMVIDVDRFKFINDTIGHPAGDAVLETVSLRLKRCVREADTVARLGGDEFLVLLSEISDVRDVVVVSERIQDEMRAPMYVRQQQMLVSVSVGVVIWDTSYRDAEDLLHAADTAMYQAKAAGGGCYRIFDERMHRAMLESIQAEAELREAVEKEDFQLEYQPVIDLATQEIVSLEALVRWQHPNRGVIPPNSFIGIAETSGLIVPLGDMIIDQLCRQLSQWRSRTCPAFGLPVSLNISPRQLTDTDFVGTILNRMTEWHLSPGSLMFEITEAALNRDAVRAKNAIKELCTLGMRVCLDDFGTGPSSLHHLMTFPGQEIKLDCALISRLKDESAELALARAITDLAHALQLVVIAEGVESERDWGLLKELGCDRAQGFYSGEPMRPDLLLDYLAERRPPGGNVEVLRRRTRRPRPSA